MVASKSTAGGREDREDVLAGLLPEDSILTLEDYLEMQWAIGHETRFRILHVLNDRGGMSASELNDALGIGANTLHYHLDKLVDVGLVLNRKRKTADQDGPFSYYRATALGTGILEHGITELMRGEHDFLEQYGE